MIDQEWTLRRIDRLARGISAARYLEIGLGQASTFAGVNIPYRTGVDPVFRFDEESLAGPAVTLIQATSDEFFRALAPETLYDLVYLDGLHTFDQTLRDLRNALAHSHAHTVILVDDTIPRDEYSTLPDPSQTYRMRQLAGDPNRDWHGDVYKVVFAVHDFHPELEYRTILGSGNPQTLVWRSDHTDRQPRFEDLADIARLGYGDLLEYRELMHPCDEEAAIEACLTYLRDHEAG